MVEMAEAEVRFKVPMELKEEMDEFPEVKVEWSETVKEAGYKELKNKGLELDVQLQPLFLAET